MNNPRLHDTLKLSLLLLTLTGYPLISLLPLLLDVDSRSVSLPYRLFFAALALIIILQRRKSTRLHPLLFFALNLFWLLYFWRLVWDCFVEPRPLEANAWDYIGYALGVSYLPMLAFFSPLPVHRQKLALHLSIILSAVAASALLTYSFLHPVERWSGRLGTDILNPISFGHLGVVMMALALYAIIILHLNGLIRLLYAGFVALGIYIVIVSASRGPFIALLLCNLYLLYVVYRRNRKRAFAILFVGTLLLLPAGYLLNVAIEEQESRILLQQRIEDALNNGGGESSALIHYTLLHDAWNQFEEHPITGSGFLERESGTYPHNILIESFMSTGIVGGLLLIILTLAGLRACVVLARRRSGGTWTALVWLDGLIGGVFSGSIWSAGTYWCFLAVVLTLVAQTGSVGAKRAGNACERFP